MTSAHHCLLPTVAWPADVADPHRDKPDPLGVRANTTWTVNELHGGRAIGAALLDLESTALREELYAHPEWRRMGVIQSLLDAANVEHDRKPRRALELTTIAMDLVGHIPQPQVAIRGLIFRADVLKEHTHALRLAGDTDGALRAIRAATALLASHAACAFPLAVARLVEAQVLHTRDESTTALHLLKQSALTFHRYEDHALQLDARITEGWILFELRQYEQALDVFRAVYHGAQRYHLPVLLARAANNQAYVMLELRQPDCATRYLNEAERRFAALGMHAELVRVAWARARLLLGAEQFAEALVALRRARDAFLSDGVLLEAATATLDIAQALLGLDDAQSARAECEHIVGIFSTAHQYVNVQEALTYLQSTPDPDRERISAVRTYFTRLADAPSRAFPYAAGAS